MACRATIVNTGNWGGDIVRVYTPAGSYTELRRGESVVISDQGRIDLLLDLRQSKVEGDGFLGHPVIHLSEPIKHVK